MFSLRLRWPALLLPLGLFAIIAGVIITLRSPTPWTAQTTTAQCGNGAADAGETCMEPGLGTCASGQECIQCRCQTPDTNFRCGNTYGRTGGCTRAGAICIISCLGGSRVLTGKCDAHNNCYGSCGDGILNTGEQCDTGDSNSTACTEYCTVRSGWTCTGSPSRCTMTATAASASAAAASAAYANQPDIIIDDSRSFLTSLGSWSTDSVGYLGSQHVHDYGPQDYNRPLEYGGMSTTIYTPGEYGMYVTWAPSSNFSGEVTLEIDRSYGYVGSPSSDPNPTAWTRLEVNQKSTPTGWSCDGRQWKYIGNIQVTSDYRYVGAFFSTGNGAPRNSRFAVDAVMFVPSFRQPTCGTSSSASSGGSTASVSSQQSSVAMCAATIYAANQSPSWMVSADFNRDNHPDLAVLGVSYPSKISIYLNSGNGTFQPKIDYSPGGNFQGIAAGDFDRDGSLDLALTNNNGSLAILRNDGSGQFNTSPQSVSFSPSLSVPEQIAVGDVNNDGDPDLLVGSLYEGANVLYGAAGLTFTSGPHLGTIGGNSLNPTLVDVNADGYLDAVTTPGGAGGPRMTVYLNDHTGHFDGGMNYDSTGNPYTNNLHSGDVNNDGKIDLVQATNNNNDVIVWVNNGNGTFRQTQKFTAASGIMDGALADFNGDGKLDLFLGVYVQSFSFYRGNGDGTFGPSQAVSFPVVGRQVVAKDFDDNGLPDIAMALAENQNGVLVYLNNGSCLSGGQVTSSYSSVVSSSLASSASSLVASSAASSRSSFVSSAAVSSRSSVVASSSQGSSTAAVNCSPCSDFNGCGYCNDLGKQCVVSSSLKNSYQCQTSPGPGWTACSCDGVAPISSCHAEGQVHQASPCCPGLSLIRDRYEVGSQCWDQSAALICAACGNEVCNGFENRCNCPEDCSPSSSSSAATCTDSDGGHNYTVVGTITNFLHGNQVVPSFGDVCFKDNNHNPAIDPNILLEGYCGDDGYGHLEQYVCPNGCENSVCLPPAASSSSTSSVLAATCGNGRVDSSTENCDDGNTVNGDGCSTICRYECTDTDPTNDSGVRGTVRSFYCSNGTLSCGETVQLDSCVPGSTNQITQYSCAQNAPYFGAISAVTSNCAGSQTCQDGICGYGTVQSSSGSNSGNVGPDEVTFARNYANVYGDRASLCWSTNNRFVAYTRRPSTWANEVLYLLDTQILVRTEIPATIQSNRSFWQPHVLLDGRAVGVREFTFTAATGNLMASSMWIYDTTTGQRTQITSALAPGSTGKQEAFARDAQSAAFLSQWTLNSAGTWTPGYGDVHLYLWRRASGTVELPVLPANSGGDNLRFLEYPAAPGRFLFLSVSPSGGLGQYKLYDTLTAQTYSVSNLSGAYAKMTEIIGGSVSSSSISPCSCAKGYDSCVACFITIMGADAPGRCAVLCGQRSSSSSSSSYSSSQSVCGNGIKEGNEQCEVGIACPTLNCLVAPCPQPRCDYRTCSCIICPVVTPPACPGGVLFPQLGVDANGCERPPVCCSGAASGGQCTTNMSCTNGRCIVDSCTCTNHCAAPTPPACVGGVLFPQLGVDADGCQRPPVCCEGAASGGQCTTNMSCTNGRCIVDSCTCAGTSSSVSSSVSSSSSRSSSSGPTHKDCQGPNGTIISVPIGEPCPTFSSSSSSASSASPAHANLAILNFTGYGNVAAGTATTYTVSIKNAGPDTVPNVYLNFFFPDGFSFISATSSPECTLINATGVRCIPGNGTMAVNASATFTIGIQFPSNCNTVGYMQAVLGSPDLIETFPSNNQQTLVSNVICSSSSSSTATAACGNNAKEGTEQCDDGNQSSEDGCSYPACQIETGWTCTDVCGATGATQTHWFSFQSFFASIFSFFTGEPKQVASTCHSVCARQQSSSSSSQSSAAFTFKRLNGSNTSIHLSTSALFGTSIAPLGDIDSDGTPDIAVFAPGPDDPDTNGWVDPSKAHVYILHLTPQGSVKSFDTITYFVSDPILDHISNGGGITTVGDLDGNGVTDLAVATEFHTTNTNRVMPYYSGHVVVLLLQKDPSGVISKQSQYAIRAPTYSPMHCRSIYNNECRANKVSLFGSSVAYLGGPRRSLVIGSVNGAWYSELSPAYATPAEQLEGTFAHTPDRMLSLANVGVYPSTNVHIFAAPSQFGIDFYYMNAEDQMQSSQRLTSVNSVLGIGPNDVAKVVMAGDLDGNGVDDLFTSGDSGYPSYQGMTVKVLLQKTGGSLNPKAMQTMNSFTDASGASDPAGGFVSAIGDIDGNGKQDFAVGAPQSTGGGAVWLLLSKAAP